MAECPVVTNLGDNRTLLPDNNIEVSSDHGPIAGNQRDVREVWCASGTDSTPSVILTFTEPLYIVYATTRGTSIYWVRDYSYYFVNTVGRSLYSNVDGQSVCGYTEAHTHMCGYNIMYMYLYTIGIWTFKC